jgi:predicted MFS family arabinose efflux permease
MDVGRSQASAAKQGSWLGAFAHPAFVLVWAANTIALIGIAMYDTTSGWLMTSLDLDPFDVSLLRAATTAPMFLITLPAGAIADIFNARRLIVVVSWAIVVLMTAFGASVAFDAATPLLLLATTFLLSAAWSLNSPAWLSILPNLVPQRDLPGAIAAHGVSYNLSRTIGPALGGLVIAKLGMSMPIWSLAAANLGVVGALLWWRGPRKQKEPLPAERLGAAVRTGLRHVANNRLLRATLIRTLAIYPFTAAYWGLLPLIARRTGGGAEHYGLLLSAISAGAILGTVGQRIVRERISLDWGVVLGTLASAAALVIFGKAQELWIAVSASILAGAAWLIVLTNLYLSAQNVLPAWVRGRGLAAFLTVIFGAMTIGSAFWGEVASRIGLTQALYLAAGGLLAGISLTWRRKLEHGAAIDLSPSLHWGAPRAALDIDNDRGPILVKIEYHIDPDDRVEFLRALDELGQERRRDGAFAWGVFEDAGAFGRFEEAYLIESWLELMHLRERVTNADRMLEEEIRQMLKEPPRIEFLVAAERQPLFGKWRPAPAGA